jgi:hypothetical protein
MRRPEVRARLLGEESFFAGKAFAGVIFAPANLYPIADGRGKVTSPPRPRPRGGRRAPVGNRDRVHLGARPAGARRCSTSATPRARACRPWRTPRALTRWR